MTNKLTRTALVVFALAITPLAARSLQAQPAGGKLPPEAGAATTPAVRKPANATKAPDNKAPGSNTKGPSARRKGSAPPASAALSPKAFDGKWWTTGNGFGDSEVVLSQTGSWVSGVIRYADGRTGSIEGKVVGKRLQHSWTNSSGGGGTGWLELSWNNFLGGPWQNAKERNGSWTLTRFEGKWCFGGSRDRIRTVTHDARGRMTSIAEDGTPYGGRLEGPLIFLDSDLTSIEGKMNFRHNRLEWSSGFFWTWCGR